MGRGFAARFSLPVSSMAFVLSWWKRSVGHRVALRRESYGGNRALVLHHSGRGPCGRSGRRPFRHECGSRVRHCHITLSLRMDGHC